VRCVRCVREIGEIAASALGGVYVAPSRAKVKVARVARVAAIKLGGDSSVHDAAR
jgi:hypothetical protein